EANFDLKANYGSKAIIDAVVFGSEKPISKLFPSSFSLHPSIYKPSSPLSHFTSLKPFRNPSRLRERTTDETKFLQSRCRISSFYCLFCLSLFTKPHNPKMARSLSNVKLVSAFVSQGLSNAIFRRGFAATAAQPSVSSGGRSGSVVSAVMKKKGVEDSNQKISWVPDPKTGYYRPETGSNEIDPAELRAALLNNKQ
ncbi:unnamed protein product, partial [Thlaspi arvense]